MPIFLDEPSFVTNTPTLSFVPTTYSPSTITSAVVQTPLATSQPVLKEQQETAEKERLRMFLLGYI